MTEKLKPCPFCASKKITYELVRNFSEDYTTLIYSVIFTCKKCFATVIFQFSDDTNSLLDLGKLAVNQAIEKWNTRAPISRKQNNSQEVNHD